MSCICTKGCADDGWCDVHLSDYAPAYESQAVKKFLAVNVYNIATHCVGRTTLGRSPLDAFFVKKLCCRSFDQGLSVFQCYYCCLVLHLWVAKPIFCCHDAGIYTYLRPLVFPI
jgi:hypothetical protein